MGVIDPKGFDKAINKTAKSLQKVAAPTRKAGLASIKKKLHKDRKEIWQMSRKELNDYAASVSIEAELTIITARKLNEELNRDQAKIEKNTKKAASSRYGISGTKKKPPVRVGSKRVYLSDIDRIIAESKRATAEYKKTAGEQEKKLKRANRALEEIEVLRTVIQTTRQAAGKKKPSAPTAMERALIEARRIKAEHKKTMDDQARKLRLSEQAAEDFFARLQASRTHPPKKPAVQPSPLPMPPKPAAPTPPPVSAPTTTGQPAPPPKQLPEPVRELTSDEQIARVVEEYKRIESENKRMVEEYAKKLQATEKAFDSSVARIVERTSTKDNLVLDSSHRKIITQFESSLRSNAHDLDNAIAKILAKPPVADDKKSDLAYKKQKEEFAKKLRAAERAHAVALARLKVIELIPKKDRTVAPSYLEPSPPVDDNNKKLLSDFELSLRRAEQAMAEQLARIQAKPLIPIKEKPLKNTAGEFALERDKALIDRVSERFANMMLEYRRKGITEDDPRYDPFSLFSKAWGPKAEKQYWTLVSAAWLGKSRNAALAKLFESAGMEWCRIRAEVDERTTHTCLFLNNKRVLVSSAVSMSANLIAPDSTSNWITETPPQPIGSLSDETQNPLLLLPPTSEGGKFMPLAQRRGERARGTGVFDMGEYDQFMSDDQLALMIGPPPYHFLCRSILVPDDFVDPLDLTAKVYIKKPPKDISRYIDELN